MSKLRRPFLHDRNFLVSVNLLRTRRNEVSIWEIGDDLQTETTTFSRLNFRLPWFML